MRSILKRITVWLKRRGSHCSSSFGDVRGALLGVMTHCNTVRNAVCISIARRGNSVRRQEWQNVPFQAVIVALGTDIAKHFALRITKTCLIMRDPFADSGGRTFWHYNRYLL